MSSEVAEFIFTTCQAGAEGILKNEIAREWTRQNSSQFVRKPPVITQGEVLVYKGKAD